MTAVFAAFSIPPFPAFAEVLHRAYVKVTGDDGGHVRCYLLDFVENELHASLRAVFPSLSRWVLKYTNFCPLFFSCSIAQVVTRLLSVPALMPIVSGCSLRRNCRIPPV